jgi:hypothetical protein
MNGVKGLVTAYENWGKINDHERMHGQSRLTESMKKRVITKLEDLAARDGLDEAVKSEALQLLAQVNGGPPAIAGGSIAITIEGGKAGSPSGDTASALTAADAEDEATVTEDKPVSQEVPPTEAGKARFDRLLQNRIRDVLKAGGTITLHSPQLNTRMLLTAIDTRGELSLKALRAPITQRRAWSKLTMQECRRLALAVLREDNSLDNAVVAFYMLATGNIKEAPQYLRATDRMQEVMGAFDL